MAWSTRAIYLNPDPRSNKKRLSMIYRRNWISRMKTNPCCAFRTVFSHIQVGFMITFISRYKIGETFLHMPHLQALKRLERDQQEADQQFMRVADQVEEIESQMKALKVVLYAKFGKAINLEE